MTEVVPERVTGINVVFPPLGVIIGAGHIGLYIPLLPPLPLLPALVLG